jgi:hypothetical protein
VNSPLLVGRQVSCICMEPFRRTLAAFQNSFLQKTGGNLPIDRKKGDWNSKQNSAYTGSFQKLLVSSTVFGIWRSELSIKGNVEKINSNFADDNHPRPSQLHHFYPILKSCLCPFNECLESSSSYGVGLYENIFHQRSCVGPAHPPPLPHIRHVINETVLHFSLSKLIHPGRTARIPFLQTSYF